MVGNIRPAKSQRIRKLGGVTWCFKKLKKNLGSGRVGHRAAQTVHYLDTRRKSQHAMTIHRILTSRGLS